jgi:UDP-3-O-[3-hydroxymyristoyl] glucosamine N-acyltransferase
VKLGDISKLVRGTCLGDPDLEIVGAGSLEEAQPGQITFLADKSKIGRLASCRAGAAIIPPDLPSPLPAVAVDDPYRAFVQVLYQLYPPPPFRDEIHPLSFVGNGASLGAHVCLQPFSFLDEEVTLGSRVWIGSGVHVGRGCRIGNEVTIHPNTVIYPGVEIGDRVVIHGGCVIGGDGFGYMRNPDGSHFKIPQIGGVRIEEDVEIGCNVCIDRATLGFTVVHRGTKIDNLVHIAHNVSVGENTLIAGCTGISGSVQIGKNVMMGGQVGITDHVRIGDGVLIAAKSGVSRNLKSGIYGGHVAMPLEKWKRAQAVYANLPDLLKRLRKLEKSPPQETDTQETHGE